MPWVIDEASQKALDYFQNHEKVEMVIRDLKKRYEPFEDMVIKWADDFQDDKIDENMIRDLIRNQKKDSVKLDQIMPKLDQIFKPMQNLQILSILNTALSAANLVASVAGTVVICSKLNNLDYRLNDLQKEVADIKEINYETQIAGPCRKLMDDYKLLAPSLRKGKLAVEDKVINLIRECKDHIISIYNLRYNLPLDVVLSLIFMLLPVFENCILVYYQQFYDPNQEKHPLHDSFMSVFDLLSSPGFIDQIQDYMFIDKNQTNRQVNEYLDCQRLIVYSYKKQIEQLLEDLKICGSKEGYADVIQWTRQYTAQQARVLQTEIESRVGAERAEKYIKQAMHETAIG